jgi:archaemetzincin
LTEIIPELQNTSRMEFFIKPLILDIADAYSFERRQYYSTKILKLLLEKMSEEESKVIGIIKFDLFIPVLTYVFGEAQFDGKCSLVSLFRFHEEFYSSNSDTNLLKKRIIKRFYTNLVIILD